MADFGKPAPPPPTALGNHKLLSSTCASRVSPLILGEMSLGNAWPMGDMFKSQAFALLDAFFEAGGNFIDTANCYHEGQSEEWLGEWMADKRDSIVLSTKYSFLPKTPNDFKTPANNNLWGNSRRSMLLSLRDSLNRLKTSFIDIFYVHWWDFTASISEVMNSLHMLVESGQVMYLGISDSPAWIIAAANEYARSNGKTQFSIVQGQWNLLRRDLEREILPMATHFGMAIAPWNVLGSGRIKSKDQSNARGKPTDAEDKAAAALEEVAKARNASVQAIAIAYVGAKSPNVIPLVGGRKVEHLQDNIKALEITLTPEEVEQLEEKTDFEIGFPADFAGQDWKVTGKFGHMLTAQGPLSMS